ncbi:MAG TPA: hypothetical protein VGB17_15100 [Pyrinomonadaceae bacterium]|jgi:uncharacterized protein (DUF2267 family)
MDELIKRVSEKTGLSDEKARDAVNTVMGFLKERLPGPIAGQVDNVLNSAGGTIANVGGTVMDRAGDMVGGLGSMFGGGEKKE